MAGTQYSTHITGVRNASLVLAEGPELASCLTLEEHKRAVAVRAGHREFSITREQRFFFPAHVMRDKSESIWRLRVRSIIRNRHTLQMSTGELWNFRTPLFSLALSGIGESGALIEGRVGRRKNEWIFSLQGVPTPELMSGIAFLHWRWYFAS